jgi:hypothetical protein
MSSDLQEALEQSEIAKSNPNWRVCDVHWYARQRERQTADRLVKFLLTHGNLTVAEIQRGVPK